MYDAKLESDNCWIRPSPTQVWYPTTFYRYACKYGNIEGLLLLYCCHNFSDQICVNHKDIEQARPLPLCDPNGIDMGAPLIAQENGR